MASNVPPMPGAAGAPVPKKTSPVVWVLAGCGVLVVLVAVAVAVGGFFIAHKVKQAGLDPELIQRHPELAVVKMAVAANPDAEIVSIDEDKNIVSVRDKRTGKVVTLNFDDVKKGRWSLESEGQKVQVETGGTVTLPSWFPAYPGATAQGVSSQGPSGSGGTFGFKTNDSAPQVTSFFEDELKKAGLTVETVKNPAGAILSGEGGGRKAVVNIVSDGSGTSVSGTFEEK